MMGVRRRIRRYLPVALAAAVWGLFTACGPAGGKEESVQEPKIVLTYAENQAEDYPTTRGAYRFADLVKERSGGRIEILVYAEAELGDEQAVVEQLQFGGIDFVRASISSLAEFVPAMNVLQMPYLYRNSEHMWQVLDGEIGEDFMKELKGYGLVGLSWYDAGVRNFYTSERPIRTLEDMKGLTIRVQESVLMEAVVESMGGKAVQMTFDKVYSALETKTIDGAENNWPSYESMDHYEVAKYFTLDEHTRVPEMQMISQRTWDSLSPEDQAMIRECAQESAAYERDLWEKQAKESENKVRAAGCEVIELSDAEKKRFQEATLPVYERFCGDYMDVIEEIFAVGEK